MAGPHRRSSPDIKAVQGAEKENDLLSRGHTYAFFQAIRLLQRQDRKSTIRVRPALNLGFAAADIDRIDAVEEDDQTRYEVTANFLGLYGASSPLPTFYTEDLITEAGKDESVSRDFLDIIHHRLYDIYFQCWQKYRQFLQVSEDENEFYIERLYCLLGLGPKELRRGVLNAKELIRYIGLFTQFPRSAVGLKTLLRDAVPDVPIELVPCVMRMAKIPQAQRMNVGMSGSQLGVDTFVGEEIEDRMGKFQIQIGPLKQADFLRFTAGKPDFDRLTALVEIFITEPLEYEIELILMENQAQTVCLGDSIRSVLGVTSWVFSESSLGEVKTRFAVSRS